MVQFIAPGIVSLIAIAAIIVVIGRHARQAAALDLESLPAEQEAAMKAALLERRLKRKMTEAKNRIVPVFRRLGKGIMFVFNSAQKRVAQLEQRYRRKPQLMTPVQQQEVRHTIQALFADATKAVDEEDWPEAEKKFIEILGWDPKHAQAYLALAEMYFHKKEFAQAKETFQFFFRLVRAQKAGEEQVSLFSDPITDENMQAALFDYAQALQVVGDLPQALVQVSGALVYDPNNPKYLDKLLELSILVKDRNKARETLDKLKEVNPDNQKLASLEEEVRAL